MKKEVEKKIKKEKNIHPTIVWAFQALKELKNQTGMVECETWLAEKLIGEDKVQNTNVGALNFKEIQSAPIKKVIKKTATKE